jgi:hypothetical protein
MVKSKLGTQLKKNLLLFLLILVTSLFGQQTGLQKVAGLLNPNNKVQSETLPGFLKSFYYNEQIRIFESPSWAPEVKFHINAPSVQSFDQNKKVLLIFFALPNGNSTDETIGKALNTSAEWHYDIQHIGAQTRFLRNMLPEYNIVVTYLESNQKSWPTWRTKHPDSMIKTIIDSVRNIFSNYNTKVAITGHSGGGSFMFGFLNSYTEIPSFVERIAFLDSDYNYDDSYAPKFINWLKSSSNNYLSVLAYNDSIALYEGQPVVSATGGTWYRSKMMVQRLKKDFTFTESIDDIFWKYSALNGRVKIILKTNPDRKILHTVQVEMNGFIQSIVSGTPQEEKGYVYYTAGRIYASFVQPGLTMLNALIPPRPPNSMTGSQFMNSILNMNFTQREPLILSEIKKGNIPDFCRNFKEVQIQYNGRVCKFQVMPDYLAIGSNEDFCRIPMGPKTAQEIADYFGCTMPTPLMSDSIWNSATIKLSPVAHLPVGNANELVSMFITHNQEIEQQRLVSGKPLGELIAGIKKDVVITNLLVNNPNKVAIYGWHYTDGRPIQPLYTGHINSYVDYSHGIRLVNSLATLDGNPIYISQILKDQNLYKVLSNETGAMTQPSYNSTSTAPAGPKSFAVVCFGEKQLQIIPKPDPSVWGYYAFISKDGIRFTDSVDLAGQNNVISNLDKDSLCFIKLKSYGSYGLSSFSEVLAGIPTVNQPKILIVNGFDRASTGNTKDYIRQHGKAIKSNNLGFCSATNDAVIDGLVILNNYEMVDYILGDESTADETFSTVEQTLVKKYLESGGNLFVSGCEIAWDLDTRGSASDKDFCNNYLKVKYLNDAPLGKSGTYYRIQGISGTKLGNVPLEDFDNGKNGTINVLWPDALKGINGGIESVQYYGVDPADGVAGIYYDGVFGNGTSPGKVVTFGVPFETIYPESDRIKTMREILLFFGFHINKIHDQGKNSLPLKFELEQNYPNPFNPVTRIGYSIAAPCNTSLKIYNLLGEVVASLVDKDLNVGNYTVNFNGNSLSSGTYFYVLRTPDIVLSKKMLLIR